MYILSEEQHGFRSDRSCQDCIFSLPPLIENRQLEGTDTFACFIDFKKTFDCVNRDLLWKKMENRSMGGFSQRQSHYIGESLVQLMAHYPVGSL